MNISPFLDKKLARRFKTYDFDGNGYIEQADFEQAVTALCDEFGHGSDSPTGQRLYDSAIQLWQHLVTAADANADGHISEAEYKQAFANGVLDTPETFEREYIPYSEAIMAVIDVNGDGKISIEEEVRYKRVMMHLAEVDVRAAFHSIDTDGDGFITLAEKMESIRQFYLNNDPQANGVQLLGSLDA